MMKKLTTAVISILLLSLLLCGAAAAAEWTPVSVTDTNGDVVIIPECPDKIISLAPACESSKQDEKKQKYGHQMSHKTQSRTANGI